MILDKVTNYGAEDLNPAMLREFGQITEEVKQNSCETGEIIVLSSLWSAYFDHYHYYYCTIWIIIQDSTCGFVRR